MLLTNEGILCPLEQHEAFPETGIPDFRIIKIKTMFYWENKR